MPEFNGELFNDAIRAIEASPKNFMIAGDDGWVKGNKKTFAAIVIEESGDNVSDHNIPGDASVAQRAATLLGGNTSEVMASLILLNKCGDYQKEIDAAKDAHNYSGVTPQVLALYKEYAKKQRRLAREAA